MPYLTYEKENFKQYNTICGVDEVGRGCIAGPVVACCVVITPNTPLMVLQQIKDSKKLSAKKRENIAQQLKDHVFYSIKAIDVDIIDKINILQAAKLAMKEAYNNLLHSVKPDVLLVDGNQPLLIHNNEYCIIKGDNKSLSIAAASILAKVYRDNIMLELAKEFKGYYWEKNVGYGTKEHLEGILKYGITKHHRKSFAPVKNIK